MTAAVSAPAAASGVMSCDCGGYTSQDGCNADGTTGGMGIASLPLQIQYCQ